MLLIVIIVFIIALKVGGSSGKDKNKKGDGKTIVAKFSNKNDEDREIKEIVLWDYYLIYAISFGIAIESKKQFQNLDILDFYLFQLFFSFQYFY